MPKQTLATTHIERGCLRKGLGPQNKSETACANPHRAKQRTRTQANNMLRYQPMRAHNENAAQRKQLVCHEVPATMWQSACWPKCWIMCSPSLLVDAPQRNSWHTHSALSDSDKRQPTERCRTTIEHTTHDTLKLNMARQTVRRSLQVRRECRQAVHTTWS